MTEKILYIEADEEITGVISRLKKLKSSKVAIVVPKGAIMLQSIVNLKMLKKHEKDLGKEVTIVTTDRIGLHLASEVGFEALRSLDSTSLEKDINVKDDEKLNLKNNKEQELPKDLEEDDFKATVSDIGYDDKKDKDEKKSEGPNIVFKEGSKKKSSEKEPELKNKSVDSNHKQETAKSRKKMSRTMKWLLTGFGGIATIAVLLSIFFILPKATIIVSPVAEKTNEEFEISALLGDNQGNIKGELVEISKQKSKTIETTGTKNIGEKAKGNINLTDTGYNSRPNTTTLVAGTRFVSPDGLVFKSTANVTIPGFETVAGNTKPGSTVSVPVEASEPGEKYNISASNFSIPALSTKLILASSSSAMAGGSTRVAKVVAKNDIENLKNQLSEEMLTEAKEEIGKKTKDKMVLEAAIKEDVIKEEFSAQEAQEAQELTLNTDKNYWLIVFSEKDVKNEIEGRVTTGLDDNKELVKDRFDDLEYKIIDQNKDNGLIFSVSASVYIIEKLELDQSKYDIAGKDKNEAIEYFKGKEKVLDAKVEFWPFWVNKIPLNRSRIFIEIEVMTNG